MTIEQVVITAPAPKAPEGHEAAMIAKVDAANVDPNAVPTEAPRPDWLPSKFKTVEEMAASYKELESKLGAAKAPAAAPVEAPAAAPAAAPAVAEVKPGEADPAAAGVAKAGLDMGALEAEFAAEGKLSEASVKALEAVGFNKQAIDTYIAGRQALVAQYDTAVQAEVGGADKYTEMVTWAASSMDDADLAAYNEAVSSGDLSKAKLAVAGLSARFTAAVGNEPKLLGGAPNGGSADVFESTAQVTDAMKDPRYQKDPAYRASVQAKLGRSKVF